MYSRRDLADGGGLTSYGDSAIDGYRQVGIYVGRSRSNVSGALAPFGRRLDLPSGV